jgi:hypothetical protein
MRLRVGLSACIVGVAVALFVSPALGSTWTLKTTPLPSVGTEGTLRGISCITNFCAAVGDFWNPTKKVWGASGDELKEGATWTEAKVEANHGTEGGQNADLRGVTCWGKAAKPSCRAAGTYGEGGKRYSTIQGREETGSWISRVSPNPSPSEGNTTEYRGISCLSAGAFCMAAGQFNATPPFEGEKESTFAAEWDAEAWVRLSPILNPGNRSHGHFTGVSCVEPSEAEHDCIAAGGWGRQIEGKEIIQAGSESWNNESKKWAATEATEPNTAENADFYAISCKSTTACLAVGNWKERETGRTRILADTWNGTKWSVSLSSGPEGGFVEGTLRGVSCTAAEDCEAVGDYFNGSGKEVPLAYRLKEKKWEVQTTEVPTGATTSQLEAVSCSAAEVCEAVGTESTSTASFLPFGEAF